MLPPRLDISILHLVDPRDQCRLYIMIGCKAVFSFSFHKSIIIIIIRFVGILSILAI